MKNSRFFVAAGALILGAVSILGTKPSKFFAFVTAGKFQDYSGSSVTGLPASTFTNTKTGNSVTVVLSTIGGSLLSTLITVNSGATKHPIYLQKP